MSEFAPPRRAATLTEVAKLAGVSVATASKALNGRRQVRAETRQRVVDAAEKLSFKPNALAQGLLAGRSGTVGLITGDLEGRFSIPVMMGAEDAFGSDRMSVFLCDARGDAIRERHHVEALLSRRVDGLIVVGSSTNPRPPLQGRLSIPVVYAYAPSTDAADASVISDNVGGGRLAIEHLIACGRRRIAHITGDVDYQAARDRALGATDALAEAGLPLEGASVMFGAWNEDWGRGAARSLLARCPDLDGVFCGSDQIARGVIDALREMGRDVPRDVSIVGFDNWDVLTTHSRPPLTSIDMNLERIGATAARTLFAAIEDPATATSATLPCRLVARGSSTHSA